MRLLVWMSVLLGYFFACSPKAPQLEGSNPPDHTPWDDLLQKHVDQKGAVDYLSFCKDSLALSRYIENLSNNAPDSASWTESEKLAYYLNLYNAATVLLVLRHYPIGSIKDIGAKIQIPFINTPWQLKFIRIGKTVYDLDDIEHNIIRMNFDEPRIHFALVCAAKSCPRLRNEAYFPEILDYQLEEQTLQFLADSSKNQIGESYWRLSKIFDWYSGDFERRGGIEGFIKERIRDKKWKDVSIDYMEYDWSLNMNKNK